LFEKGGFGMQRVIMPAVFIVGIGLSMIQVGCSVTLGNQPGYTKKAPPPWAPAHGYRAKHHYRYYPESHVYFDVGRGLYFYYHSGAWRTSVSLPAGIHISVGDHVTLDMDADKPYVHHSEVVKKYPPGQLKKTGKGKKKKKK
jgi:hypothetical protein